MPIEPGDWAPLLAMHRQRLLQHYLKNRAYWTAADPRTEDAARTGFLFTNRMGQVKDPKQISKWAKEVFARAGCPEHTLHGLRHDFAGSLADQGIPLLDISRALRHASVAVTEQVYIRLKEQRKREVIAKADDWLNYGWDAEGEETG